MSFRRRITVLAAAAVAVAVLLASALTYVLVGHELRGQVDTQLLDRAREVRFIATHPPSRGFLATHAAGRRGGRGLFSTALGADPLGGLSPRPNQVRGYQQLVSASGRVLVRSGSARVTLPVSARTRALARHGGGAFFTNAWVDGIHLRILAEPVHPGVAAQLAQPLTEVDEALARLRLILIAVALGGIALAALLGRLVAGAVVAPVGRLTRAAEHVARTRDLSGRIEGAGGADEIGRLAVSFNAMLDALERSISALDASVHAQRQLVADASHELRTPVTSLRTNIEILQQEPDIDAREREQLLSEVVDGIEELTALVNDLIDLARGEEPARDLETEDVRLDVLVGEALARARRRAPERELRARLTPTVLTGAPGRLGRAVNNLLDNALKYSPPDAPVEVQLSGGELTVRDYGPGISEDDRPHVFDRFYRGAQARERPGSGLGLAIVRQVVEQHGGSVSVESTRAGGTLVRVRLSGAETLALADRADPVAASTAAAR
jgi:two-component system sensor histidine kinase MprB